MEIESFFPGRIRVRSPLFTKRDNVDKVVERVHALPGVKEATGNLRTGSLTVLYDPAVVTMPRLMEAKEEMERLEQELR